LLPIAPAPMKRIRGLMGAFYPFAPHERHRYDR
jgi:hypothetical protein